MAKHKLVHAFRGSAAELRDSLVDELRRMEGRLPASRTDSFADGLANGEKQAYRDIIRFVRKIAILDEAISMNVAPDESSDDRSPSW